MHIDKQFTLEMNATTYNVQISGFLERDEHDRDVKHQTLTSIVIEDELGNLVDDTHEDYDDILEYVTNRSYDEDRSYYDDSDDYIVNADYDERFINEE